MDLPSHRRPYLTQVVITGIAAAIFVLATDAAGYRGMANALGMFLPPIVVAILLNRSWDRRAFMIMALFGVLLVTSMIIGVNFTSYR